MDVNKWFLSLPPERQAVLREDKWMLANAVAQAATEAEREACAKVCDVEVPNELDERYDWFAAKADCASDIRARSNAGVTSLPHTKGD